MAGALATYFTSCNLAGNVAASYGFRVTDTGIGTKIVNVGNCGAAFGVANGTNLTILQLLLATDNMTDAPNTSSGFRIRPRSGRQRRDRQRRLIQAAGPPEQPHAGAVLPHA